MCLDDLLTTDITKVKPGTSHISNIVTEMVTVSTTCSCNAPNDFRVSHGSGTLEQALPNVAKKYDVKVERDDSTHVLSLQGLLSREVLAPHASFDLMRSAQRSRSMMGKSSRTVRYVSLAFRQCINMRSRIYGLSLFLVLRRTTTWLAAPLVWRNRDGQRHTTDI